MGLDFDALIAEHNAALADNSSWLGSGEQLRFLADVVHGIPSLEDVNVSWVRRGGAAYWEPSTRTITAERLAPMAGYTAQYLAKMVLIGVVHETLHARYTTPTPTFERRLSATHVRLHRPIRRLFNVLEDGRITALGTVDEPGFAAGLHEHVALAVEQARTMRRSNAETERPADPRQQLFFALEAYALSSQVPMPLHPSVHEEFARLRPTIDTTRRGSTDDCGIAAIETRRGQHELPAVELASPPTSTLGVSQTSSLLAARLITVSLRIEVDRATASWTLSRPIFRVGRASPGGGRARTWQRLEVRC